MSERSPETLELRTLWRGPPPHDALAWNTIAESAKGSAWHHPRTRCTSVALGLGTTERDATPWIGASGDGEAAAEALATGQGLLWIAQGRGDACGIGPATTSMHLERPSGANALWRRTRTDTDQDDPCTGGTLFEPSTTGFADVALATTTRVRVEAQKPAHEARPAAWFNPVVIDVCLGGGQAALDEDTERLVHHLDLAREGARPLAVRPRWRGHARPGVRERARMHWHLAQRAPARSAVTRLVLGTGADPGAVLAFAALDTLGGTFVLDLEQPPPERWTWVDAARERPALVERVIEHLTETLGVQRTRDAAEAPPGTIQTLDRAREETPNADGIVAALAREARCAPESARALAAQSRIVVRVPSAPIHGTRTQRAQWTRERAQIALALTGGKNAAQAWLEGLTRTPEPASTAPWSAAEAHWPDALHRCAYAIEDPRPAPPAGWRSSGFTLGSARLGRRTLGRGAGSTRIVGPASAVQVTTGR